MTNVKIVEVANIRRPIQVSIGAWLTPPMKAAAMMTQMPRLVPNPATGTQAERNLRGA